MGISAALPQQRIAWQIVLLGGWCDSYLGDVVLEVAIVAHDLGDTKRAGIVKSVIHCVIRVLRNGIRRRRERKQRMKERVAGGLG